MTALRALVLLVGAIVVGGAIGVLVLDRRGEASSEPPAPDDRRALAVSASLEPRVHLFGDPVEATVDVTLDSRVVLPNTVRVTADFTPYEVRESSTTRTESGDVVRLRHRFTLACVRTECLPGGARRDFELPLGQVRYLVVDAGENAAEVRWPVLQIGSRLDPFALEQARFRVDTETLPAVSYRLAPGPLAALLLAAAALLAASALLLAYRVLPAPAPVADADAGPATPPLVRALAAVERESRNGSTPEQRRALERLARELAGNGRPELAARARRLAWSRGGAAPDDVDALVGDVRSAGGGA